MSSTTPAQRRAEEVRGLSEDIFAGELESTVVEAAWGKSSSVLTITIQSDGTGAGPAASFVLRMTMTNDYPHKAPLALRLDQPVGLSRAELDTLLAELRALAAELAAEGGEAGFVVIEAARDWMKKGPGSASGQEARPAPRASAEGISLHEQMSRREMAAKAQAATAMRLGSTPPRASPKAMRAERVMMQKFDAHRDELNARKLVPHVVPTFTSLSATSSRGSGSQGGRSSPLTRSSKAGPPGAAAQLLQQIGAGQEGISTVYLAVVGTTAVTLNEYKLQCMVHRSKRTMRVDRAPPALNKFRKEVESVAAAVNKLAATLLGHPNVAPYIGMNHRLEGEIITANVMVQFCSGGTLAARLAQHGSLTPEAVNAYTPELIAGLEHLHSSDILHQNVTPEAVLIDGNGSPKWAYFGTCHRRLKSLATAQSIAAEQTEEEASTRTDKRDLAAVVVVMLLGRTMQEAAQPVPKARMRGLQHTVVDWITKHHCSGLMEASMSVVPRGPMPSVAVPDLSTKMPSIGFHPAPSTTPVDAFRSPLPRRVDPDRYVGTPDLATPRETPAAPAMVESRYLQDWEADKEDIIGKGGFGVVVKVRNLLDQRIYAVKKIPLESQTAKSFEKIRREVTLLSNLSHQYVVRYYQAWIEGGSTSWSSMFEASRSFDVDDSNKEADSSEHDDESDGESDDDLFGQRGGGLAGIKPFTSDEDDSVVFFDSKESSGEASEAPRSASPLASSPANGIGSLPKMRGPALLDWMHTASSRSMSMSRDERSFDDDSEDDFAGTVKGERIQRVLYIQMEYCDRNTLRTLICSGQLGDNDDSDVWRLLRQITEALAYIHQMGMIHRDLKPENVFLDADVNVKLGDFGLATRDPHQQVEGASAIPGVNDVSLNDSGATDGSAHGMMTSKIGTWLYMAPELRGQRRTNRTSKVDMFSLGIILFEMLHRGNISGHERIKVLTQLRHTPPEFPSEWDDFEPRKRDLVRMLVHKDPHKRPSALKLLHHEHLPERAEDELAQEVTRVLGRPAATRHSRLMTALFTPRQELVRDERDANVQNAMYSCMSRVVDPRELAFLAESRAAIAGVFERHGASELKTPVLLPGGSEKPASACVELLDSSGGLVQLPFDMRSCFVRGVLQPEHLLQGDRGNGPASGLPHRRYSVGSVFRVPDGGRFPDKEPSELPVASYDIATNDPANFMYDAEVIHVCAGVIDSLLPDNRQVVFRVGHARLQFAVLKAVGCTNHHAEAMQLALRKTHLIVDRRKRWRTVKQELAQWDAMLPEAMLDKLDPLIGLRGPLRHLKDHLEPICGGKPKHREAIQKALFDLAQFKKHVDALGLDHGLRFDLGLAPQSPDFRGIFFELTAPGVKGKEGIVLGTGGSYSDRFTEQRRLWGLKGTSVMYGVGVELSMHAILEHCGTLSEPAAEPPAPDTVLVFVDSSHGGVDLLPRLRELQMAALSELWKAELRAIGVFGAMSHRQALAQATAASASMLVAIKDSAAESKMYAVEHLQRAQPPASIAAGRLAAHVKSQLRGDPADAMAMAMASAIAGDGLERQPAGAPAQAVAASFASHLKGRIQVTPIADETGSKHKSKAAQLAREKRQLLALTNGRIVAPLVEQFSAARGEIQVVSVNLPSDVFAAYHTSFEIGSIDDQAGFSAVLPTAAKHKGYLRDIHDAVTKLCQGSTALSMLLLINGAAGAGGAREEIVIKR